MEKENCWEFMNCQRGPGGSKIAELGICIATLETKLNGVHSGKNAGRTCWAVTGTLCGSKVQGAFTSKLFNCISCKFFKKVSAEEGKSFLTGKEILSRLKAT